MNALITLDERLASQFYSLVAASPTLSKLFEVLGVGLVYVVPVLLIVVWFTTSRKVALQAAITGLLAWVGLSKLVAELLPRPRPAISHIGVKELVFHRPDSSFPSDHSAFLLAVAVSFYLAGYPKLGHLVLALAIITGITRVGIGVHFPGDILAGWLVGLITVYLIQLIDQPLDNYVLEPIVRLARKLHL